MCDHDHQIKILNQTITELQAENIQLRAENARLNEVIAKLNETILRLNNRIAELERRLGLDSSNSGKPPSSDGLQKPSRVVSLRGKSGKKSGGQPGHKGATLEQVLNPDITMQHNVSCCPHCNTDLTTIAVIRTEKAQVFEVPTITKPIVTEHQFDVKVCPHCKKKVKAQRDHITQAPVQYGEGTKTLVTYLNAQQLIPEDRTSDIMNHVFGVPISVATIESIINTCAQNIAPVVETINQQLQTVPVKGADESGLRVHGKTIWTHTLCNDKLVHYRISEKRGDVPKDAEGIIVHDHFVSYYAHIKNAQHALCNAHHLRELKAVTEYDKEPWAHHMTRLLLVGNHHVHKILEENQSIIEPQWLTKFDKLYDKIIAYGLEFHECLGVLQEAEPTKKQSSKRGRIKRRPGHNLLLRLQMRKEDVLRFLHNINVPFTNNQSEQALRMIKVKQKVSGGFRTNDGANDFLKIRSYTATAQKQEVDVFDAIRSAVRGHPINFASTYWDG